MVQTTDRERTRKDTAVSAVNIPLICIDAGNRKLAYTDREGGYHQMPAFFKKLSRIQEIPSHSIGADSVLLEFAPNERYVVGELAKKLNGSPMFLNDKSDLLWLMVAAVLEPIGGGLVGVDEIRMLCENSADAEFIEAAKHIEELTWLGIATNRAYKRNGQDVLVSAIRKVTLVDEGIPAMKFLSAYNLIPDKLAGRNQLIVDVGGGVTVYRILSEVATAKGSEFVIDRELDRSSPGTSLLAEMIGSYLQSQSKFTPDYTAIMDAIAASGDDFCKLRMGANVIDFRAIFDEVLPEWIKTIEDVVRNQYINKPAVNALLGGIWIVGGSAPLLKSKVNDRVLIPTHAGLPNLPQQINTLGMAL
jgi:hypothetical protein